MFALMIIIYIRFFIIRADTQVCPYVLDYCMKWFGITTNSPHLISLNLFSLSGQTRRSAPTFWIIARKWYVSLYHERPEDLFLHALHYLHGDYFSALSYIIMSFFYHEEHEGHEVFL